MRKQLRILTIYELKRLQKCLEDQRGICEEIMSNLYTGWLDGKITYQTYQTKMRKWEQRHYEIQEDIKINKIEIKSLL